MHNISHDNQYNTKIVTATKDLLRSLVNECIVTVERKPYNTLHAIPNNQAMGSY